MLKDAISFDQVLRAAPEIISNIELASEVITPTSNPSNLLRNVIIITVALLIIGILLSLYLEKDELKPIQEHV